MAKKEYVTQEGYNELLRRLEELKKLQQENIIAIQDARSQGDLSENADYSAAREQQAEIVSKIAEVEAHIRNAEIIKEDDKDVSNLGRFVTVKFLDEGDDSIETYQIVGSIEADALNGKISSDSPLGHAVLLAKVGDIVMVKKEDGDHFDVEVMKISSSQGKKK